MPYSNRENDAAEAVKRRSAVARLQQPQRQRVRLNSYGREDRCASAGADARASREHLQAGGEQFVHPLLEQRARVALTGEMVVRID